MTSSAGAEQTSTADPRSDVVTKSHGGDGEVFTRPGESFQLRFIRIFYDYHNRAIRFSLVHVIYAAVVNENYVNYLTRTHWRSLE